MSCFICGSSTPLSLAKANFTPRYGTYSTVESVEAGLDMEMPGPTRWRGQMLLYALLSRLIDLETINERVRQVLKLADRVIGSEIPSNAPRNISGHSGDSTSAEEDRGGVHCDSKER